MMEHREVLPVLSCASPGCLNPATHEVTSSLEWGEMPGELFTLTYPYCDECFEALKTSFAKAGIPRKDFPQ